MAEQLEELAPFAEEHSFLPSTRMVPQPSLTPVPGSHCSLLAPGALQA